MWDLSSPSRDWNCALKWKHVVLTIGLSGSPLRYEFYRAKYSTLKCPSQWILKCCVCRSKPPNDHQIKLRTFSALQQALLYAFLIILPNSNHYSDVNQHLLVFACVWPLSICDHEKYTLSCLSFSVPYYMLWDLSILLHALVAWCFVFLFFFCSLILSCVNMPQFIHPFDKLFLLWGIWIKLFWTFLLDVFCGRKHSFEKWNCCVTVYLHV